MVIEFDGREVTFGFGELNELVLAYATTIHKSQGSEYPAVVIPFTTQLSDAAAEPALHCRHPWQAARRHRRAEEGDGDLREGEAGKTQVVETDSTRTHSNAYLVSVRSSGFSTRITG